MVGNLRKIVIYSRTRPISHSFAALTREILFLPLEHKIQPQISDKTDVELLAYERLVCKADPSRLLFSAHRVKQISNHIF